MVGCFRQNQKIAFADQGLPGTSDASNLGEQLRKKRPYHVQGPTRRASPSSARRTTRPAVPAPPTRPILPQGRFVYLLASMSLDQPSTILPHGNTVETLIQSAIGGFQPDFRTSDRCVVIPNLNNDMITEATAGQHQGR